MKVLNTHTNEAIYEADLPTIREVVEKAVSERADLYEANLYGANLRGADLEGANLRGANLYGADLYRANLYGANLRGANLRGADLYGADLYRADLYGAKNILVFKSNSSGRLFYIVNGDEIKVQAGCFWGTIQELKDKIAEEHSKETHWDYLMACDWAERLWKEEAG